MTRLGIACLWLLHAMLPVAGLAWLGERLGGLLYRFAGARRHVVATNLRLCFPEVDETARAALVRAHFRAAGRAGLLETVAWWGRRETLERLVRVEGMEHLESVRGRPLIVLAPHFLGLNPGGIRLSLLLGDGVSMYARIKNPVIDRLMLHSRTRFGNHRMITRQEGLKPILRGLKRGQPFYYLPDMDLGRRNSVFVPFFGVPAATVTALPRIAQASDGVVLPVVTRWEENTYVARLYPPWLDFPSGDDTADARRMNAFIEERVRERPEQYFWMHRRFKTQPEGKRGLRYA
jgi:KDO2-lipid IV(A) lauroyltransferase